MSLVKALSAPANRTVCRKLVFASICLVTLPLLTFFAFFKGGVAAAILGPGSRYELALSAGVSVFVINVILATYVYVAFTEGSVANAEPKTAKKER